MDCYKPIVFLKGPNKSAVNVIKYSSNGRYLGVGTIDGYVGILKTPTYTWKQDFNCAEHHAILDIDFSENCNILAAATNSIIKLCNCTNGEVSTINVLPESIFTHLSFGKNKNLAAATEKYLIYIFDDYEKIHRQNYKIFNLHLTPITSLNFINHSFIISSDIRGYCIKWNSTDYSIPQECFPTTKNYTSMIRIIHTSISPDHKYVLLTYMNSDITSWEILDSTERIRRNLQTSIALFQTYTGHNTVRNQFETRIKAHFWFTPEWKLVISGSEDPVVYVWNFETALIVKRIHWHEEPQSSSYAVPNPAGILEFTTLQRNGILCVWKREE